MINYKYQINFYCHDCYRSWVFHEHISVSEFIKLFEDEEDDSGRICGYCNSSNISITSYEIDDNGDEIKQVISINELNKKG